MQEETQLSDIFEHCSANVKVTLYNSYCCSIYCCTLISVYHKTVLDKLSVACTVWLELYCRVLA